MNRRLRPAVVFCALIATALTLTLSVQSANAAHVFVDPGHGGSDPGAVYGVNEADVNLQIALRLRSELQARGHIVSMSRTTAAFPTSDSLQARCDLANSSGADVFVSVHNNAAGSAEATGYETWYHVDDPLGKKLASSVHAEVLKQISLRDRGTKVTASLYVLRRTHMPAVLVECGFLSNPADRAYVTSSAGQAAYARGIAAGVDSFLSQVKRWPRIAGADRYGTAAALAADGWPDGAETVILATGENWPDALASAPLSKVRDAPLLLTRTGSLPAETGSAIARLSPERIIVLGGKDAVAPAVASAAARRAGISEEKIHRIEGNDRYETAARIATEVNVPDDGRVCVVTGTSPADAVSISPYAGANGIPILLTGPKDMGTATAQFLKENTGEWKSTIVVGGTSVIDKTVVDGLPSPQRLAGADRYATNTTILRELFKEPSDYFVVNGEAYPDCLAAGVRGTKNGAAIMLVKPHTLSDHTRGYLETHGELIDSITMVGGPVALPYLHDWMIDAALN